MTRRFVSRQRSARWGGVGAVALACVAVGCGDDRSTTVGSGCNEQLVTADWNSSLLAAAPDPPTARQRIADLIVDCNLLRGRTTQDVTALLGRPQDRGTQPLTYVYWLGPERGEVPIDDEWLSVAFDPIAHTVSEASVYAD